MQDGTEVEIKGVWEKNILVGVQKEEK